MSIETASLEEPRVRHRDSRSRRGEQPRPTYGFLMERAITAQSEFHGRGRRRQQRKLSGIVLRLVVSALLLILSLWGLRSGDALTVEVGSRLGLLIGSLLLAYAVAGGLMRVESTRVTKILQRSLLALQVISTVLSFLLGMVAAFFLLDVLLELDHINAAVRSEYVLGVFSLLWLGSCLISGAMDVPQFSFWQSPWRRWLGDAGSMSFGAAGCVAFMGFVAMATPDPRAVIAAGAAVAVAELGWWINRAKRRADMERAVAWRACELIVSAGWHTGAAEAHERDRQVLASLIAIGDSVRSGAWRAPLSWSTGILVDTEVFAVIRALISYMVADSYDTVSSPLVRTIHSELRKSTKPIVLAEMVMFAADLRHLVLGSDRWVGTVPTSEPSPT